MKTLSRPLVLLPVLVRSVSMVPNFILVSGVHASGVVED